MSLPKTLPAMVAMTLFVVTEPKPILDALAPLAALDALARPIDFAHFRDIVAGAIDRLRSEEVLDARAAYTAVERFPRKP